MDEEMARSQIVETGVILLNEGLTARTWGNISARLDEDHFIITPSGLSYTETTEEDLAICKNDLSEWTGPRKPSSEKGVHAAAYEFFPEAEFVIHTHQPYASAIAVYMPEKFDITPEEEEKLGGIGVADYGLPGTDKLKNAVRNIMAEGKHVVFMKNHGVVIAGKDREEALEKARLLESICERNCAKIEMESEFSVKQISEKSMTGALEKLKVQYPFLNLVRSEAVLDRASAKLSIHAQLDDMAQMMGETVPVVQNKKMSILMALKNNNAILVPGVGGLVYGTDADDTEALKLLLTKAAITANHVDGSDVAEALPLTDVVLMHTIYLTKYSKLKNKK